MADSPSQDEKTEDATPRRLEEARGNGQVAYSSEFAAALGLLMAALVAIVSGSRISGTMGDVVVHSFHELPALSNEELAPGDIATLVERIVDGILPTMMLVLAPLILMALLVGYGQVGFRLSPKAVAPDFSKLDILKGLKRIVGARGFMRTGMAALKLPVIAISVLTAIYLERGTLENLVTSELRPALAVIFSIGARGAIAGIVAIVLLSLIDLLFQRFQFQRDMRMTKQEVKDEAKSSEGDPQVKAKIRQIQRELARSRMMQDVPDATVVLTNPTHYAVALRYDESAGGRAPVVVAKGVDEIAQRIKQVARQAGVLVYEDPPLARALHRTTEIGAEIPEDLFGAVAKVLAYLYRLEGRAAGVGA